MCTSRLKRSRKKRVISHANGNGHSKSLKISAADKLNKKPSGFNTKDDKNILGKPLIMPARRICGAIQQLKDRYSQHRTLEDILSI
ncbi:MAG: hypothetical protein COW88_03595 [Candidatus Lloydbacteria bacterium CG22_combo_CG10-13_8_21_14_all_47_15]|uniref:Uncharacterized protein n=1 Tax=Candidatus Lloydbacteria bacterium CG22_combo_CG10-13_8_21_14_all_47_15 TaxID=1974635 RepID=A0A2H0CTF1_9BACT|nr:MAG: hypothetical protein COW88_03595 [Candidatus Lloydbacteria bacterium CG22_combo_CG10-13_8_21_14_all_47_15]